MQLAHNWKAIANSEGGPHELFFPSLIQGLDALLRELSCLSHLLQDESEDGEEEEEEDGDDDDDDEGEEACPPGCDQNLYEKVGRLHRGTCVLTCNANVIHEPFFDGMLGAPKCGAIYGSNSLRHCAH